MHVSKCHHDEIIKVADNRFLRVFGTRTRSLNHDCSTLVTEMTVKSVVIKS